MCYTRIKREIYLILDPFPDDSGHFITIEFDDGVLDLDFLEGSEASSAQGEL
jgi:hypothetical protein